MIVRVITPLILCACMLAGCVSGKITAFKDPFFKGPPMRKFLIIVNLESMEVAENIESIFARTFSEAGVIAVPRIRVMPPVREYTDDELRQLIMNEEIEGYVELTPSGYASAKVAVPAVSQTTGSAKAYGSGNSATAYGRSTTVTYGGGTTDVLTSMTYKCAVMASSTKDIVWRSEVLIDLTQSSRYATVDGVLSKVASLVIDKMQEDGVAYTARTKSKSARENW